MMRHFGCSLEVLLFLGIKAHEDIGGLDQLVSANVIDGEGQVGNGTAEIKQNLVLPLRESLAIVDKPIVGFKHFLDITEHAIGSSAGTASID